MTTCRTSFAQDVKDKLSDSAFKSQNKDFSEEVMCRAKAQNANSLHLDQAHALRSRGHDIRIIHCSSRTG